MSAPRGLVDTADGGLVERGRLHRRTGRSCRERTGICTARAGQPLPDRQASCLAGDRARGLVADAASDAVSGTTDNGAYE